MKQRLNRKPRDVRGAIRQGWHPIYLKRQESVSFLGLELYCTTIASARWLSKYDPLGKENIFVFESEKDASVFALKWT